MTLFWLFVIVFALSTGCSVKKKVESPPNTPDNFQIVESISSGVYMMWQDTQKETGYNLYRGTSKDQITKLLATLGQDIVTYIDTDVQAGTTYYYKIVAFNNSGKSASSKWAMATIAPPPTTPEAPGELHVTQITSTGLTLTWTDQSTNELGFKILRGITDTNLTEIGEVGEDQTQYQNSNLQPNTTYYFQVVAYNLQGESPSEIISWTTLTDSTVPVPPSDLRIAETTTTSIRVVWNDNSTNEDGFILFRGTSKTELEPLARVEADIITYTDELVESDITYYYQVIALNSVGESAGSNIVSGTPRANEPNAPLNLSVSEVAYSEVTLHWQDQATDEDGFYIHRGTDGTNFTWIDTVGPNEETYVDSNLSSETNYYYQVVAYNENGESATSNTVFVTTLEYYPAAPSDLQVEETTFSSVSLSWQDHSTTETGFVVLRSSSYGGFYSSIANLGPNTTSYIDIEVTPLTMYYYKVKAINTNGSSDPSSIVMASVPQGYAQVTGQIIDQYGVGLADCQVYLGQNQTITLADGSFTFSNIAMGFYQLKAKGGDEAQYLLNSIEKNIDQVEVDLGQLTAYQVMGVGVVIESTSTIQLLSLSTTQGQSIAEKKMKLFEDMESQYFVDFTNLMRPASFTGLDQSISFILLRWEPIGGKTYIVEYWDGSQFVQVWDSEESHPEDPLFDQADPQAYLDLSSELVGYILGAGYYQFRVVAKDSASTEIVNLPMIDVSLGMQLDSYPTDLQLVNEQLTWAEVSGANGYRVQIFDQTGMRIYTSGAVLLTDTTLEVPSLLNSEEHYTWWVDAHAVDDMGWTTEITRGISGFIR